MDLRGKQSGWTSRPGVSPGRLVFAQFMSCVLSACGFVSGMLRDILKVPEHHGGSGRIVSDQLLLVGDLHLGRRPVGLDDVLSDHGLSPNDLSPAAGLRNLVDEALGNVPRAVVFAGDLVDQDDDVFEAYDVLAVQMERLRIAGIPVYAVAGNHDGLILPRLIDRVRGVTLMGAGGTWSRHEVEGDGRPIDLIGWSFPARSCRDCPLDHPTFESTLADCRSGASTIGVFHGDLDVVESRYAPVSRKRLLDEQSVAAWFLGHVHVPGTLTDSRPVGYLGSVVGLDIGETGSHGVWRVGFDGGSDISAMQIPLAPIRWEMLEIDLTGHVLPDADAVHEFVISHVRAFMSVDPGCQDERLRCGAIRITLTGRLDDRESVREFKKRCDVSKMSFHVDQLLVIIESVRDSTMPLLDLRELSREQSPVGHVAGILQQISSGSFDDSFESVRQKLSAMAQSDWNAGDHELPESHDVFERAAQRVLDVLLSQREEDTA